MAGNGGAIDSASAVGVSCSLVKCTLTQNSAALSGGALTAGVCSDDTKPCVLLQHTRFQLNSALFGGAVLFRSDAATFNASGQVVRGAVRARSYWTVDNTTFANNSAAWGGAIGLRGVLPPTAAPAIGFEVGPGPVLFANNSAGSLAAAAVAAAVQALQLPSASSGQGGGAVYWADDHPPDGTLGTGQCVMGTVNSSLAQLIQCDANSAGAGYGDLFATGTCMTRDLSIVDI